MIATEYLGPARYTILLQTIQSPTLHYFLSNHQAVLSFTPGELVFNQQISSTNLILTSPFYLGILVFIMVWLYPLISRLQIVRKTAIEFGQGDLSKRIVMSRTSYINDIEMEFNRMAQKK